MLARHSMPAFRTMGPAPTAVAEGPGGGRPRPDRSWRDVAASVRDSAKQAAFGLLIALVIVLVPLLEALRFAAEAVFRDID